jgi:Domain of unknown function (DUF6798)
MTKRLIAFNGYSFVFGAVILATALLSVVRQGFDFGVGNNALQLPILQRAANQSLYPNDPFVDTLDDYFSALWRLLALAKHVPDWSGIFLLAHVGARVLFATGLYALLRHALPERSLAVVGTVLLMVSAALPAMSPVGRSDVLIDYFNHTEVAVALTLLAFAAAVWNRWFISAVCTGVVFNLNAFMGAWALFALGIAAAFNWAPQGWAVALRRFGVMGVAFSAIAAPTVYWIVSAVLMNRAQIPSFDYRDYLREYYPDHFFIGSTNVDGVVAVGCTALAGFLALWLRRDASRTMTWLLVGSVMLFVLGAALPFVSASPTLLNMHFLRVDSFILLLAAVAAVGSCLHNIFVEQHASGRRDIQVLSMVACAGLLIGNWLLVAAGLSVASSVHENSQRDRWIGLASLGACALMVAIGGVPQFEQFRLLSMAWIAGMVVVVLTTRSSVAIPLALLAIASYARLSWLAIVGVLGMAFWVWKRGDRELVVARIVVFGSAVVATTVALTTSSFVQLAALSVVVLTMLYVWNHQFEIKLAHLGVALVVVLVLPALGRDLRDRVDRRSLSNLSERDLAWRDVQRWARLATPVDAVFLVPPRQQGFGVLAERSIWVDWKHGAAVMWRTSYYPIWKQRFTEQERLKGLGEQIQYAKAHQLRYVVTSVESKAANPAPAYENRYFAVYEVMY